VNPFAAQNQGGYTVREKSLVSDLDCAGETIWLTISRRVARKETDGIGAGSSSEGGAKPCPLYVIGSRCCCAFSMQRLRRHTSRLRLLFR
jgi:hypothetical protein